MTIRHDIARRLPSRAPCGGAGTASGVPAIGFEGGAMMVALLLLHKAGVHGSYCSPARWFNASPGCFSYASSVCPPRA